MGDKEGAIADYNKAIEIKPDYALAYNNRGNARYNLGDKEGAIADYNKAIEIKPDDAYAYMSRGAVHFLMKDTQKGIEDIQTAAQKFRAQGNMDMYQKVQELLRQLQQQ